MDGAALAGGVDRSGSRITGLPAFPHQFVGRQLEFLEELRPTVSRGAVLWNPANPTIARMVREANVPAQASGVQLHRVAAFGARGTAFLSRM